MARAGPERLRTVRKFARLTPKQLAKRLGVSVQYIEDLEAGRKDWETAAVDWVMTCERDVNNRLHQIRVQYRRMAKSSSKVRKAKEEIELERFGPEIEAELHYELLEAIQEEADGACL